MSSTLSEGVRVPDIGSVNWGADVNFNWGLLNTALANISGNVKTDVANTWTATQTFTETISGSIDRAVGDEDGNNIKTALASKAADNAVVHLAGAETITGDKTWTGLNTFSGNVTFTGTGKIIKGLGTVDITQTSYSENILQGYFTYQDAITRYFGGFGHRVETDGTSVFIFDNSNFTTGGVQGVVALRFEYRKDFSYSLCCGGANLGNATRKWKTLNGINPGALGMINTASYISIDTTDWSVSDVNRLYINGEDPTYPGWLYIRINNATTSDKLYVRFVSTAAANPAFTAAFMPDKYLILLAPCPPNTPIYVVLNSLPTTCRFYPCLGNV